LAVRYSGVLPGVACCLLPVACCLLSLICCSREISFFPIKYASPGHLIHHQLAREHLARNDVETR